MTTADYIVLVIVLAILGFAIGYIVKAKNSTKYKKLEIDFPNIPDDTIFNYVINISSELPKNKQRIAQTATMLMEKQLQYQRQGQQVDLITPE